MTQFSSFCDKCDQFDFFWLKIAHSCHVLGLLTTRVVAMFPKRSAAACKLPLKLMYNEEVWKAVRMKIY